MKDSESVLEADLAYAVRMVRKGFGSPEQAAQACGVCLADLQARLAREEPRPRFEDSEKRS